jgi:hypothetical protein
VLDAISKLATEMKSRGTDIEIDPAYVDHLETEGLTREQIRLVLGLAQRIAYSDK